MNKLNVLLLCLCLQVTVLAQTNLSGIVNQYSAVVAVQSNACNNTLTLDDVTPFEVGDQVVIIQMQGAQINEGNNGDFGTVSNLNGAGWYELNEILAINGNEVNLGFQFLHSYEVSGKVQLVKMPVYDDAIVQETLTAESWNGTTGGVLALEVSGELTLNADINTNGLGFRGGMIQANEDNDCSWLFQQDDYWYSIDNWRGSAKGEGVAAFIVGKEHGRGPQANGGGGGNDHNSGGGGGANVSIGGSGGENNEPSTFGCKGTNPGLGGIALTNDFEDRLFLGGGGGAGHENNEVATNGGNGGGIIILKVNDFNPNNFAIRSNGQTPVEGGGDGAGGGGAGGTIALNAQNIQSLFVVEALGGDGGLVDNNNGDRCHGPGGGGSGGRVVTNLFLIDPIALNLLPGVAGLSVNSMACSDGTNGGTDGDFGLVTTGAVLYTSSLGFDLPIAGFDNSSIVGNTVDFTNQSVNALTFAWDFGDGGMSDFSDPSHEYLENGTYEVQLIVTNECGADTMTQTVVINVQSDAPTAAFSQSAEFGCAPFTVSYFDESVGEVDTYAWEFPGGTPATSSMMNPQVTYNVAGIYEVTLTVSGPGGMDQVMIEEAIEIGMLPVAGFTFTVNNDQVNFQNTSSAFDIIGWDFGDGTMDSNLNPEHIYSESGMYSVELTVSNDCGTDVITQIIEIDLLNPLSASFSLDDGSGCTPHSVNFENLSTGDVTTYNWVFAGGQPLMSSDPNPQVLYEIPGVYTVQLEVSGSSGSDVIIFEDLIEIVAPPDALFGFNVSDNVVDFVNVSTNATAFQWSFGDGSANSTEENPSHEFMTPGVFDVTLIATNDYCGNAITESIYLDFVDVEDLVKDAEIKIFPNPANDLLQITTKEGGDYSLRILSLNGAQYSRFDTRFNAEVTLDIGNLPSGIYIIEVQKGDQFFYERLVKI